MRRMIVAIVVVMSLFASSASAFVKRDLAPQHATTYYCYGHKRFITAFDALLTIRGHVVPWHEGSTNDSVYARQEAEAEVTTNGPAVTVWNFAPDESITVHKVCSSN